jgi:hypothetical protein
MHKTPLAGSQFEQTHVSKGISLIQDSQVNNDHPANPPSILYAQE